MVRRGTDRRVEGGRKESDRREGWKEVGCNISRRDKVGGEEGGVGWWRKMGVPYKDTVERRGEEEKREKSGIGKGSESVM